MKSKEAKRKTGTETSTCKSRRTDVLNLPDAIWHQYQNSLTQDPSVETKQQVQTVTLRCTLYSNMCAGLDTVEKTVTANEPILEKNQISIESNEHHALHTKNTAESTHQDFKVPLENSAQTKLKRKTPADESAQEEKQSLLKEKKETGLIGNHLMKKLCVNLSDCKSVQLNCVMLMQRLNELMRDLEEISSEVVDTKQLITNCSVRTVIARKEVDDFFKGHLISADTKMEKILSRMELQKSMITDLQRLSDKLVMPTSYSMEDDASRSASLLKAAQDELSILRIRNDYLEDLAKKHKSKLIRMRKINLKLEENRRKYAQNVKQRMFSLRRKLLHKKSESVCKVEEDSKDSHKVKLENLINMNFTMMKAIVDGSTSQYEQKMNFCVHDNVMKSKDETIEKLRNQVSRLKKQNETKNDKIKQLMLDKKKVERNMAMTLRANEVKNEKNSVEIKRLNSLINDLNRKRDRWLTDKFHQKCHSVMLFNKIRQLETQQGKFLELTKQQKRMKMTESSDKK